jgi:hypothetical protein
VAPIADGATTDFIVKVTLGEAVADVRSSDRLTDSAVCLVAAEHGPDRQLERLLAGAGRITTAAKPILEVNPHHPLIVSLAGLGEDEKGFKDDAAHLLLDEARAGTRAAHLGVSSRWAPAALRCLRRGRGPLLFEHRVDRRLGAFLAVGAGHTHRTDHLAVEHDRQCARLRKIVHKSRC